MNEMFIMKSGKVVTFYSALSYNGINVYVNTTHNTLDKDERALFRKELSYQRDVVSITYGPNA